MSRSSSFTPPTRTKTSVEGYRPALKAGQPTFELKSGPLLRAAETARGEPHARHFLVIDEINRGQRRQGLR